MKSGGATDENCRRDSTIMSTSATTTSDPSVNNATPSSDKGTWTLPIPDSTTIGRRKNCRSLRSRNGLIRYAFNNTSQNGEDGVIARLFELLPPSTTSSERYCVDVGAWDGIHLSNTYSLLVGGSCGDGINNSDEISTGGPDGRSDDNNTKWSGVLIEADEQRVREMKNLHDPLGNICICAEVSCQPDSPQSLTNLLRKHAPELPRDFDFLSIDVDGMDYWVFANILGFSAESTSLESSNTSFQPKVICIEFNPTMPLDLIYVQPRHDSIRHGSSLSAMCELANAGGYTLVETTLFNAFFVRNDLYQQYLTEEVPDTSIEALHEITMGTAMYQLYDGTIKLWGCKKLLWHRMSIDEEKMQMLPASERQFPFAPPPSGCDTVLPGAPTKLVNLAVDSIKDGAEIKRNEQIRESAIDMSPYCQSGNFSGNDEKDISAKKRECSTRLSKMLQTDGFALVRGTGMSGSVCDNALKAAKLFLHDAEEPVRRSCLTKDRARRGYSPMCTENFASLIGEQGPNDLVKKFRVGPESSDVARSDSDIGCSSIGAEAKSLFSSLHQPNAWPNDEIWGVELSTFFRASICEYYESMCNIADRILHAICDGIIAENSDLARSIRVIGNFDGNLPKNHTSILTLLGYQLGSRHKKGSKGYLRPLVAAHTDVGVITVLLFDSGKCASLQRKSSVLNDERTNSEWVDVNLPTDSLDRDPVFVVNVGDCLSELSGGYLRSTLHRVVPKNCHNIVRDVARTCLALFVGLEPSATLTLPLTGEDITYEEWRKMRIARATAVLNRT
ncbi:hypothetical protein ACHAXS_006775 [Conticribra weissflogii]